MAHNDRRKIHEECGREVAHTLDGRPYSHKCVPPTPEDAVFEDPTPKGVTHFPAANWQEQASKAAKMHLAMVGTSDLPDGAEIAVLGVQEDLFEDPTPPALPELSVSGQPDPQYEWRGRQNLGYLVKDPATGDYRRYKNGKPKGWTRATTFNKAASDRTSLNAWTNRMTLKGAAMSPEDLARVVTLDPENNDDARELDRLVAAAQDRAGANEGSTYGTKAHGFLELMDAGLRTWADAPEEYREQYRQYHEELKRYGLEPITHLIERTVAIQEFGGVVGRFDRVFYDRLNDRYIAADVKTGKTMDYARLETETQLWIYAHGINQNGLYDWNTDTWVPPGSYGDSIETGPWSVPTVSEEIGLVMHMPRVGPDAGTVFFEEMNLVRGAEYAEECARVRGWSRPKRVAWGTTPSAKPEAPGDVPMNVDSRDIWLGIMDATRSLDEARTLWERAAEAGEPQAVLDELAATAKALHVKG